jgi:hypothetical protein
LRGVESVGTIHYARDINGRVIGVQVQLHGAVITGAAATGSLSQATGQYR